jgi:hypothetical protein
LVQPETTWLSTELELFAAASGLLCALDMLFDDMATGDVALEVYASGNAFIQVIWRLFLVDVSLRRALGLLLTHLLAALALLSRARAEQR